MPTPTLLEIAVLLFLSAVSLYLFCLAIGPVIRTIRSSRPDPGFRLGPILPRLKNFTWEVLLQGKVIKERPLPGIAHALVFWGFLAFSLVSLDHLLRGLGVHLLDAWGGFGRFYFAFAGGFALAVIASMVGLAIRRFLLRPRWLGEFSKESAIITTLILTLM
ncbi:MAG TPA: [Fe-S]-binding protein, partial [Bryobacteraceae bacterium]|nr:[Fe-S]-binding protein [Bryobacteraceae bacterium]